MPADGTIPARPSVLKTLGWAVYLACSWTWCIGMFLPVLLVRDFGIWGFVVFAVPNVIGAAAMGWVVRDAEASRRLVGRHRAACAAFSLVTITFHAFFVAWILRSQTPHPGPIGAGGYAAILGVALAVLLVSVPAARARPSPWPGVGAYLLSLSCLLAFFLLRPFSQIDPLVAWPSTTVLSPSGLLFLAPVCAFGFGLCPYLDLTFHTARQQTGREEGAAAFTLGFVSFFVPMILFTLAYTGMILEWRVQYVVVPAILGVLVHLLSQACFTSALHGRAAWRSLPHRLGSPVIAASVALGASIGWLVADTQPGSALARQGLSTGEVIYRVFMTFYGLVFPAYVWLCMIQTRDGHSGTGGASGRRKVHIFLFAVAVAAPMFWMGFIERRTFFLVPGLGMILLARLALPRNSLGATGRSTAGA